MKNKLPLLIISGLVLINLVSNSCKKEKKDSLSTLLTNGKWQLASVNLTESVGDTVKLDTTLNTLCDSTQIFTFNADNTCSYTNFDCLPQPVSTGHWQITANQLFLNSDMVCKDTTATGNSKPFLNAQIYNLGQYSLVLRTGDIQFFSSTTRRRVFRYGFVKQKAATQ